MSSLLHPLQPPHRPEKQNQSPKHRRERHEKIKIILVSQVRVLNNAKARLYFCLEWSEEAEKTGGLEQASQRRYVLGHERDKVASMVDKVLLVAFLLLIFYDCVGVIFEETLDIVDLAIRGCRACFDGSVRVDEVICETASALIIKM